MLALLFVLMTPLLSALRIAFPSIPDRMIPLLSLVGGLAAGVAHALFSGASFEDALFSAAIGMAGGGASVAVHQSLKARVSDVAPPSGTPKGSGPQDGPPTPRSPKPGPSEMARLAMAVGVIVFVGLPIGAVWVGCTAQQRAIATTVAQDATGPCGALMTIVGAPELAPTCALLDDVTVAISELIAEHQAASVVDAGAIAAKLDAAWRPSTAEVHRRVKRNTDAKRAFGGQK